MASDKLTPAQVNKDKNPRSSERKEAQPSEAPSALPARMQQAKIDRRLLTPDDIIQLQEKIGNRAVQRLLDRPISTQNNLQHAIQLARGTLIFEKGQFQVKGEDGAIYSLGEQNLAKLPVSQKHREALKNAVVEYEAKEGKLDFVGETLKRYSDTELKEYQAAWQTARHYHGTNAIEDIKKIGLDPEKGGTRKGADDGESKKEGKVFVAQQRAANLSLPYADNEQKNIVRPMFGKKRGNKVKDNRANTVNDLSAKELAALEDKDRLFRDPNMGGAYFTAALVPPEEILFGPSSDLLKSPNAEKILSIILEYYIDPKPTIEELKQIHLRSVDDGYISDEPGDKEEEFKVALEKIKKTASKPPPAAPIPAAAQLPSAEDDYDLSDLIAQATAATLEEMKKNS
jgi:hypothetical protein